MNKNLKVVVNNDLAIAKGNKIDSFVSSVREVSTVDAKLEVLFAEARQEVLSFLEFPDVAEQFEFICNEIKALPEKLKKMIIRYLPFTNTDLCLIYRLDSAMFAMIMNKDRMDGKPVIIDIF